MHFVWWRWWRSVRACVSPIDTLQHDRRASMSVTTPNIARTPQPIVVVSADKPTAAVIKYSGPETDVVEGYTVQVHAATHGAMSALAVLRSSPRMYHAAMRALLWNSKSKAFLERDYTPKHTLGVPHA